MAKFPVDVPIEKIIKVFELLGFILRDWQALREKNC